MEEKNMKPFDLEAAKAGKPVCTRNGYEARIICFDYQTYDDFCIVVAFKIDRFENLMLCDLNGKCRGEGMENYDLMMATERKTGWINIYPSTDPKYDAFVGSGIVYKTKEEALSNATVYTLATIEIDWES